MNFASDNRVSFLDGYSIVFLNSIRGTCMRQNVSSLEILFKRPLSHSPYPVYPIARTKWFMGICHQLLVGRTNVERK